jgi:hypothetical protein
MQQQMNKLFNDPNESLVLKYFDVASWVSAHAEGVSFTEMVHRTGKN